MTPQQKARELVEALEKYQVSHPSDDNTGTPMSGKQGMGYFSAFIEKILSLGYKVKVESIINPKMAAICKHLKIEYEKEG